MNISNLTAAAFSHRDSGQRILQPIWDLTRGHEDLLSSPLWPVLLSVAAYFSLALPVTLLDTLGRGTAAWRYKIQPDKQVTWDLLSDTLTLTMWNHVMFILPAAAAQWVLVPPSPLPAQAPPLWQFLWHQAAGLLMFDLQYTVWHVMHHKVRFLYRHIHAVHHRYHSPFVWVTQYLHPWELVTVGFLTTTNMWFFDSHPLTVWSYMLLSIVMSVDAHIGFDFPFALHNLDPFNNFGGPPKHDMHHQKPLTNFQPFFNHWDWLMGTYWPPARSRAAGGAKGALGKRL